MSTTPRPSTARPVPGRIIYTDGLCQPRNPGGYACWGWIAFDGNGQAIFHDWGCLGHGDGCTSNIAEYTALISALDFAKSQSWKYVHVRTDSRLVVEQVNGRWACNAPTLQHLHADAQRLVALTHATLEWIPREQNTQADALSQRAHAEARRASAPVGRKTVV